MERSGPETNESLHKSCVVSLLTLASLVQNVIDFLKTNNNEGSMDKQCQIM